MCFKPEFICWFRSIKSWNNKGNSSEFFKDSSNYVNYLTELDKACQEGKITDAK